MGKLPDHVGVDFGNHSVKAVLLQDISSQKPKLVNFGSQPTPHGVINSEDAEHQKKLADALKELFAASGIKNKKVVLAIPEHSVFTRFLELPGIKEDELESAVFFQAKQFLPIPVDDVFMSSVPLGRNEDRNAWNVLVVAAPKKIVHIYQNVCDFAGLEPLAIETESVATGRAVFRATNLKQVVTLDFGSQSTDMSILFDGNMVFSQSIAIGSDALTQAIINQFNFEYNQAEEYKRNYGVVENVLEGKIYNTLKPVLDSILTEVRRGVEFYKSRTLKVAPSKYVLFGDGALLPGLDKYIASSLGVDVSLGDPWANIEIPSKFTEIINKNRPSYAVAVGLSLKLNI